MERHQWEDVDPLVQVATACLQIADAIDRLSVVLAKLAGVDIEPSANGGGSKTEAPPPRPVPEV